MLDFFRNFYASAIGKVITIIVAALFIIGFSFLPYLIGNHSVPSQDAATVNGMKISMFDLSNYYSRLESQYEKLYGNKLTEKDIETLNLPEEALSSLIADKVLESRANVFGVHVSDGFIARNIASDKVFQKDGSFSNKLFIKVLQYNHLTPAGFESSFRSSITMSYVRGIIEESSSMVPAQYSENIEISRKKVSFYLSSFKTKKQAGDFLKSSILDGGSFPGSARKFRGFVKYIPLYSEASLVKSYQYKDLGLTVSMLPLIYSMPSETIIPKIFHVKHGYAVIKIANIYFPSYYARDAKWKTGHNIYELQKKRDFLYSYVEYLENKSDINVNKKALASFGS